LVNVVEPGSIDVIVNNPPFHEDRAIGDATAWDMFVDSQVSLRRGGRLIVVGNRHLGHHARLKKIFGNCETVASNRKFVVLSARR
ncbi:MAG: methyltransferase, partial [Actinomycetota bacterium]